MKIELNDIQEITILDINRKLKSIEGDLEYYLSKKDQAFNRTQPNAVDINKESVQGGKRENIFDRYVITSEELDPVISLLQDEKIALEVLLEKKLKASGEYKVILQTLIGLRERHYSWAKIEQRYIITGKLPVSISTCRNILRKHCGKRNV